MTTKGAAMTSKELNMQHTKRRLPLIGATAVVCASLAASVGLALPSTAAGNAVIIAQSATTSLAAVGASTTTAVGNSATATATATATAAAADASSSAAGSDFDAAWGGAALYQEVQLATNGQGGFPNYRIPALTVAPNGDLLASYDGRPTGADSPGPNSILQRRSTDGGVTWEAQTVIAGGQTAAPIKGYSDPSYIVDRETGEIFNFHVYSQDVGFWGGQVLNNGDDRKIMHANVSRSTDNGYTWTHETITSQITPDLTWRSRFAASGQGIQLHYGENAGRLIQQYTIINGSGGIQAFSAYSDDHGDTWSAGTAFGSSMDENKTVELSDGTVMMNSRDSGGSKLRKIAKSVDGGETYGAVTTDPNLIDPTNNASIVRAFPNAAQGSPEAKILLFSNAASQSGRTNGTIKMSCDDGQTWPVSKVFQSGGMAYSTLATLPDGNIGLLYEPNGGSGGIRFAKFNLAWLGGTCASVQVGTAQASAGGSTTVDVTVTNQTNSTLAGAQLKLNLPEGWTGGIANVPAVAAQSSASVTVPVNVPSGVYAGDYSLTATFGSGDGAVSAKYEFTVTPPSGTIVTIVPQVVSPKASYAVGDVVKVNYNVRNWSGSTVAMVPTGNLTNFTRPGAVNCGYSALAAGSKYTCAHAYFTVTEDMLTAGSFLPETDWSVKAGSYNGSEVAALSMDGPQISLPRSPLISVTGTVASASQASYAVGDVIRYSFKVTNLLGQVVSVVPNGNLEGFNRPTPPNCGYQNLAANGSYTCTSAFHTITAADLNAGSFTPTATWKVLDGNYSGTQLRELQYTGPSIAF